MMMRSGFGVLFLLVIPAGAENLLPNGSFDDVSEPLSGWNTDYAWSRNTWYADNRERVEVVQNEQGRNRVAKLTSGSDQGSKLESNPIPFDPGARYRCTLDVKGGEYRIYFAGYKWKPRVQPQDPPALASLRPVYKSKQMTGKSGSWKQVTLEIPAKNLSPQARQHVEQIKFITVYVWMMRTGYIDNVTVTRTPADR